MVKSNGMGKGKRYTSKGKRYTSNGKRYMSKGKRYTRRRIKGGNSRTPIGSMRNYKTPVETMIGRRSLLGPDLENTVNSSTQRLPLRSPVEYGFGFGSANTSSVVQNVEPPLSSKTIPVFM